MALLVFNINNKKIEFLNGTNEQLRVHKTKNGGEYYPCTLFRGLSIITPSTPNYTHFEQAINIITNSTKRKSSTIFDIANSMNNALDYLIQNGIYPSAIKEWYFIKETDANGNINKVTLIDYLKNNNGVVETENQNIDTPTTQEEPKKMDVSRETLINDFGNKISQFFSEFDYNPSNRFLDNLLYLSKNNYKACKEYIHSYFALSDSPFTNDIDEKIKSREFNEILDILSKIDSKKEKINNRFELYYGPAGMGKTYKAMHDYPNAPKVLCRSDMGGEDLFQSFEFIDGKAHYKNSELLNAMINGTEVILDEISLLPSECLATLQGLLDNSNKFSFKGVEYEIKKGFKVIGTMNLVVNGMVKLLPEPLIDRASTIIEYKKPINERLSIIWG